MAVFANIGGSSKQLSSIYGNIGGANKKLSSLYANIKGSNKDLLKVSYTWYRYPATSYEDCLGTSRTFTHTQIQTLENVAYAENITIIIVGIYISVMEINYILVIALNHQLAFMLVLEQLFHILVIIVINM